MDTSDEPKVLAEVGMAPARRLLLIAVLFALGILLIGVSIRGEASTLGRAILFAMGGFFAWQGERLRRSPILSLLLTTDGLFQSDGVAIASADQIKSIDRGALALKPSNGFMLALKDKHPRGWVPGLWWRVGRRVGVGGIASAGAAKFMAEQVAAMIKSRSD